MPTPQQNHDALVAQIEDSLRERLAHFGYKPGSRKALDVEASFISGAMCAINAAIPNANPNNISPAIPPRWVFGVMSGRSVFQS